MMPKVVYLVVRQLDDDSEVRRLGPMTERKAEKVLRGLLRQMDDERFYVDEEPADVPNVG